MKVQQLLDQLKKLDPSLDVLCYCESYDSLTEKTHVLVLEVDSVSATQVEKNRLDDDTPYLKFGKSSESFDVAILELTTDF